MLRVILFSCLLLTGCTTVYTNTKPFIDTRGKYFKDYVKMFSDIGSMYSEKQIRMPSIKVKFSNKMEAGGTCLRRNGRTPVITINKKAWITMTDSQREQLMFHELGHCVLNRDHCDKANYGQPMSLMHTDKYVGDRFYHEHRHWYYIELFRAEACKGKVLNGSDYTKIE